MPNSHHVKVPKSGLFFKAQTTAGRQPMTATGRLGLKTNGSRPPSIPSADLVVNFGCVEGRTARWQGKPRQGERFPVSRPYREEQRTRPSHETVIGRDRGLVEKEKMSERPYPLSPLFFLTFPPIHSFSQ